MAPRPIMPVRFTALVWSMLFAPLFCRRRRIDRAAVRRQHHAVVALGRFRRYITLANVGEYTLGRPLERIAVIAAARCVEAEDVVFFERIVGVARRQPLGLVVVRIDPN